MTFKIITFNGQSLLDFNKFWQIIRLLRLHHPDIILFQEIAPPHAHFDPIQTRTLWQTIWHGDIYISAHTAILISPHFPSSLISISPDNQVMDVSITHPKLSNISICNIYAPAQHNQQHSFWSSLPTTPPNTMIVGGDFNCIMQPFNHISSSGYPHRTHPTISQPNFPP